MEEGGTTECSFVQEYRVVGDIRTRGDAAGVTDSADYGISRLATLVTDAEGWKNATPKTAAEINSSLVMRVGSGPVAAVTGEGGANVPVADGLVVVTAGILNLSNNTAWGGVSTHQQIVAETSKFSGHHSYIDYLAQYPFTNSTFRPPAPREAPPPPIG